jgi:V/A-type H+-transporting ATPase subunit K
MEIGYALAVIGGALALAGGLIGSAIGIAIAGNSGVATLSEDPKQFRNVLLMASLPMTQTFYGLIILILILTSVDPGISREGGYAVLGAGIMAMVAELFSAIYQGTVCASGIALLPKTEGKILTPGIMMAVYVELIGVLGLVTTIIALSLSGLM